MFLPVQRRSRRGFTIVEALFAMALLFMAIGVFLTMLPYALQKNQHDAIYLQAVAAGQEYLDALRAAVEQNQPQPQPPAIPIDAGGSVVGNGLNGSPGTFGIDGSCMPVATQQSLWHCTVTVTWIEAGQTRSYVVESDATQQVS